MKFVLTLSFHVHCLHWHTSTHSLTLSDTCVISAETHSWNRTNKSAHWRFVFVYHVLAVLRCPCQWEALRPFNDFLSPADWLKCVLRFFHPLLSTFLPSFCRFVLHSFFLQLFNDLDVGFLPGNFFAENWIWEEAAAKNPILNRNKWIRVWLAGWLTALHTLHLRLLTDCVRSVIASWVLTHYWKWLKWNMFIYMCTHITQMYTQY